MIKIKLKRVYEPIGVSDGTRILIDRLWPRGIRKEEAGLALWLKEVAPSHELRKWYHQHPERYQEFKEKYIEELGSGEEKTMIIEQLCRLAEEGPLTFLYSSKNKEQNNATVLKEVIQLHLEK